jgi:hypothetical protein
MQVSATSEPAKNSTIIKLTVGEKPGFVTAIAPTLSELPSASPTLESNLTPTPKPQVGGANRAGWDTFLVILLVLAIGSGSIYTATILPEWGAYRWRMILGVVVGGLAGYDFLALGFPGIGSASGSGGRWICVAVGIVGAACGAALAWWSIRRIRE